MSVGAMGRSGAGHLGVLLGAVQVGDGDVVLVDGLVCGLGGGDLFLLALLEGALGLGGGLWAGQQRYAAVNGVCAPFEPGPQPSGCW